MNLRASVQYKDKYEDSESSESRVTLVQHQDVTHTTIFSYDGGPLTPDIGRSLSTLSARFQDCKPS